MRAPIPLTARETDYFTAIVPRGLVGDDRLAEVRLT